jgi:hypothetical protein
MAQHTVRWLSCDFPGCPQTFEPAHYRDVVAAVRSTQSIHAAARVLGWDRTPEGDDLCKRHADAHRGNTIQPELFPVQDGGHAV